MSRSFKEFKGNFRGPHLERFRGLKSVPSFRVFQGFFTEFRGFQVVSKRFIEVFQEV